MAASKRTADKQHRWLSQVEVTGVVFSEPILAEAAPGGFRLLEKKELAKFYKAREIWNLPKGMVEDDGQAQWIQFILEEVLELSRADDWKIGAAIPPAWTTSLPAQQETLRPTRALVDQKAGGEPVLLLLEVPRDQSLDRPWLQKTGRWKASPTTKLERLLRETGVELGLVTNGEAWRLLVASPSETASWITWTAQTWRDSPITLAAFRDLLGETRFFAGDRDKVVLELIRQSRQRQLDVADQLGAQIREALSLLVRELDRVDESLAGRYLRGYAESEIFEAGVAFVMRLLFSLYAEENGLLPHGTVAYDTAYGVLHLLTELESQHRLDPERLHHSFSAYGRLLAAARLIHAGSVDPDIHVAARGGQLFDPSHYPLLEGRAKDKSWPSGTPEPPRVRDSVIRELLRSLKYARADGARQLVSYRELAVEQIGHMYEGLLDRRVARAGAAETLLLLEGSAKVPEPEPLPSSQLRGLSQDALLKLVAKHTGRTKATLKKVLERPDDQARPRDPGTADPALLAEAGLALRFIERHGIVRPSGLFVTTGEDRRSQGAHYTPSTLTEPIVRRTLEHQVYENVPDKPGLLAEPRKVRSPEALLDLRVCDPAMGSGAFLVQAVRYLSERLVDAWEDRVEEYPGTVFSMPLARPAEGAEEEAILPETREERLTWANRYIVERCIYGVDRNRHAVEMAKLSLWIETLATDRPFTFLDHALKHGDSLIGLTREQIKQFTWHRFNPEPGPLFAGVGQQAADARRCREAIHSVSGEDYNAKRALLHQATQVLEHTRLAGDLLIAAFFGASTDRERAELRTTYRSRLDARKANSRAATDVYKITETIGGSEMPVPAFHWELEFPEVFDRDKPGFNAVVGNPPFLGGSMITRHLGDPYRPFLVRTYTPDQAGRADLATYFILRGTELVAEQGRLGLLATDRVFEGDGRRILANALPAAQGEIDEVTDRLPWPGEAHVHYRSVFIRRTQNKTEPRAKQGVSEMHPHRLHANRGITWRGTETRGTGFVVTSEERETMLQLDLRNERVISPYMNGRDLNSRPNVSPGRWIINFGVMDKDNAASYAEPFRVVTERVKPYRDTIKKQIHETDYWKYWDKRLECYRGLEELGRCLALSAVTASHALAWVAPGPVFQNKLILFSLNADGDFGLLQSSVHWSWVRALTSTRGGNVLNYSPTHCFETFPLPDDWRANSALEAAGRGYHDFRADMMIKNEEGLTETYNRFNDPEEGNPEVLKLRAMHAAMDRAALDTYGWSDVPADYEFMVDYDIDEGTRGNRRKPYRYRWPDEVRDEVLARLLKLNQERYERDVTKGPHSGA